ncbi:MAG: tRNA 2-selenouridine(34) synthase MnmH [Flammeovirgaceae bacterium]|nr:tRNA 2-selenouridine(34) synthase MnmH [Flammeovirgaceae bacterium]
MAETDNYLSLPYIYIMLISIDEFLTLRQKLPVMDVRSPGEYKTGHIPHVINIPLLNDEERHIVGIDYKQNGQMVAILTGFRLVGPRLQQLVDETVNVAPDKEAVVHCWRGGMRSANFCQFVGMAGVKTHQLEGGYKTYRHLALESFKKPFQFRIIGGCTGSGKSELLRSLAQRGEQVIDLEKLASHKGSAFGGLMLSAQPTTEQFQNDLFEEILKLDSNKPIWIEDESFSIGKIFLPEPFWRAMSASQVIEIGAEKSVRIERLVSEYGPADKTEFLNAMEKITKKLGGQHFKAAKEKLKQGDMHAVIDILLTYYDKAYLNGLEKKKDRIVQKIDWNGKEISELAQKLLQTNA